MAISFDGATKRIILDSASITAAEIWSRWCDWQVLNPQWPLAFRQVGGDSLGGGLYIPPYFFLLNGWRVRPMEQSHTLVITGNLFVDGGGVPVVQTLGNFNVSVQYTVPVQAQGIATGGGTAPTAQENADAVWGQPVEAGLAAQELLRLAIAALAGKVAITGNQVAFRDLGDTKTRILATTDANGQRTAVTLDGGL